MSALGVWIDVSLFASPNYAVGSVSGRLEVATRPYVRGALLPPASDADPQFIRDALREAVVTDLRLPDSSGEGDWRATLADLVFEDREQARAFADFVVRTLGVFFDEW